MAKTGEKLTGQIERITYSNPENGYTVARLKAAGHNDLVTVVGAMPNPVPGELVSLTGRWTSHAKFGRQFAIETCQTLRPATVNGIERYLGSGLIKGIGPVMAKRIVEKFGEKTLDVMDEALGELAEVEGIGPKRLEMIKTAWAEQREIREVMIFLQSHGVSSAYATRIFRYYGEAAIGVVQDNPYRLATDIYGIGFKTADKIAQALGFSKESLPRAEAGVLYVLNQLADQGHVYYPVEDLLRESAEVLEVERSIVAPALGRLALEERIVQEGEAVYLKHLHVCEVGLALGLKTLAETPSPLNGIDKAKAVNWAEERLGLTLAAKQRQAVESALDSKVLVITGGPGTGKTTITRAIFEIFAARKMRTLLAAPTGRAAKRLSEACGQSAQTIHRLLEYSGPGGGFQRNQKNPLKGDAVVVDEASMIDLQLMYHLVRAIPSEAVLIVVGDVNQLPSVGPGSVLADIIASGELPVVELNEIYRQAQDSSIIVNAHRINQGQVFPLNNQRRRQELDDFYFWEEEDPEKVVELIITIVTERIPLRFGLNPVEDIQVLSPMHRGTAGAGNLNTKLQEALNPSGPAVERFGQTLRVGDKVMQIRNNYDKLTFNGDIGRIVGIDTEMQDLVVAFDGREVTYDFSQLDELTLAYAISVHKSQGSEFPAVVIPLLTQHYLLLKRNLLYTAVTRGRQLVVIVGSKRAVYMAVKNKKEEQRFSKLRERLSRER